MSLQKLQDMDERRTARLGAGYGLLSEAELQVVPIIAKCLEGMKVAADSVDAKNVGARCGSRGPRSGLPEDSLTVHPAALCRTPRPSSSCTSQASPVRAMWNLKTSASP